MQRYCAWIGWSLKAIPYCNTTTPLTHARPGLTDRDVNGRSRAGYC
ncbi:hypothetical protein J2X09_004415 [Hydrogenophaga laconesensis]|uniref:Uncharacterized protein n=1 Tax=Hydrogenophaga laconesensis TaxID=1805971 RepID=A0ABU1VHL7_9BURK|nr:hypothetical protein [Hydrogenophaga laconesensis]